MDLLIKVGVFILYVAVSSCGLYKLKASTGFLSADYIFGFFLYGTGFLIWLIILKLNSLSVAFPVASGSLIIATQMVGYYLLNEKIGAWQLVGSLLIIVGIIAIFSGK